MLNDPYATWNLLLCVVAFPSLAWFIKREITNIHDAAKERQKELKDEIKSIRGCLGNIKKDVADRVHKDDCERDSKEKWERLHHHRHDGKTGEVVVTK